MKKPYKQLLGNRIYVDVPERKKSKLEVDANTKEALQREMLKKISAELRQKSINYVIYKKPILLYTERTNRGNRPTRI